MQCTDCTALLENDEKFMSEKINKQYVLYKKVGVTTLTQYDKTTEALLIYRRDKNHYPQL